jgi:hypothetical protein
MDNAIENKKIQDNAKNKGNRRQCIIGLPPGTATNQINNNLPPLFPPLPLVAIRHGYIRKR